MHSYQTAVVASVALLMFLNAFFPLASQLQTETTKYPFELAIGLEKTTFKVGEPIQLTWTVTNIGKENTTLYYSADDTFNYLIYNENLIPVNKYVVGRFCVVYPLLTLSPGANLTTRGSWNQICSTSGQQALPGTYYVTGFFRGGTYNMTLETPLTKITILGE
jgi:hypothetical protein